MGSTARFLGAVAPDDPRAAQAGAQMVGVPYDGAVTYRAGAREGPDGIRAASDSIETYCPVLDRDLDDHVIVDLGDLGVEVEGNGAAFVEHLRTQIAGLEDRPTLAIGGDHLAALPFLERAIDRDPELHILHIDAHADMREAWDGDPFNHSTVMRRVLERLLPAGPARLHSWGVRSGLRDEIQLMRSDPRVELVPNQREAGLELADRLASDNARVYVTLDVDGIDPGELPGTGTPEPAGLRFCDVEATLSRLSHVTGADLVEVAPKLDPTGISAIAGARLVRTLLLLLASKKN